MAGLSFFAIFCSLIASGLIGYSKQKVEAIRAATEIQNDYALMTKSATDSKGMPQPIEEKLDTNPKAKGEFGEMERFIKAFMNEMASQRNDYLLELNAIGWEKILDAERLRKDKALSESKVMIQKANSIVKKYRGQTYVLLDNARKDIDNLSISENSKGEMVIGFSHGVEKSRSEIDALWDLEAKTISEFEKIFVLLSARNGDWIAENNQILFENDTDLNAFNSHIAAIQELAARQEEIRKKSIDSVNSNLNQMKN